jgi:MYXO-CTERM domain-containing protein
MTRLEALLPPLLNAQLGGGFCVPEGNESGVHYCYETQGQCSPGCRVELELHDVRLSVPDPATLTLTIDLEGHAVIPTDAQFFSPCFLYADGEHLAADIDLELGTDDATGALTLRLAQIRNVDLSTLDFSGSGGFCSGASVFADFLKDYFAQQLADYLAPRLDEMIQGLLPDPLGLEGVIDLGAMLAGVSPGTRGALEARVVPGGFATAGASPKGLTLGVITGLNADRDPSTRTGLLASEPALCVPALAQPDFAAAHQLATTARGTYLLPAAPQLAGMPELAGVDLAVGLSTQALELLGHHAVASGALCLGIGTTAIPQLNVGTFGILVPSVAELATEQGNDPLLLVTRPQRRIGFTIGDNSTQSPALTVHLHDFEIDVYPFLFERYVRAFTMTVTVDLGINLEVEQPAAGQPWQLQPVLVGLAAGDVTVKVHNDQFVAETRAQLEAALPSVFDLLASQLALPAFELPDFAGLALEAPGVRRLTSPHGDLLVVTARLGASPMMRQLATFDPRVAVAVSALERDEPSNVPRALAGAQLAHVHVPAPETIRAALAGSGGALPELAFDVDAHDARGRALEWSWRLGDGAWRPYTAASPLVISDRALVWQGATVVGLRARVRGVPGTTGPELRVPVVIDSAGPRLLGAPAWRDGALEVAGWDVVGGTAIQIAFGRPDAGEPATAWQVGGTARLEREAALALATGGELAVFLEDERGNRTVARIPTFHGQAGEGGCSCAAGSATSGGGFMLALAVMFGLRRRRRR